MENADHGYAHSFRGWLVAAALACFPLIGQAVNWDRYTDFAWNMGTGNITTFPSEGSGQMWQDWKGARTPTATGPQFTGPTKALPFNPSPTANFKAKFSPAKMAKALFNPVNAIPFFATSALQVLLNEACVHIAGGQMQVAPGGQWEECNFIEKTGWQYSVPTRPNASYSGNIPDWLPSRQDVCNKVRSSISAQCAASNGGTCTATYSATIGGDISSGSSGGTCTIKNTSFYDLVVYNEALLVQQTTELGQEGYKPMTAADGEAKVKAKMDEWTQADFSYGYQARSGKNLAEVVDTIIESGNKIELEPGSVGVTGQTSLPGAPKTETTTNPDGTTVTKTVNTVNNYTYGPTTTDNRITITHNTTTTTNTTNNATSQTTTTTTEEEKEPEEQCKQGSQLVSCAKLDSPTEAIPTRTETLTYSQENLGFGGGSCPAPYAWSDSLGSHSINLAQFCDVLSSVVRPLVLALAALMAVFIVLPRET